MQKSVSSRMKKSLLALSAITVLIGSVGTLEAKSCDARTFNIKIAEEVATNEILNQLSNECGFSVMAQDPLAQEKLAESLFGINIKKMSLEEIFDVLIASKGLEYTYEKNMLQISGLTTRTFKIDYVNTERSGSSNTDISLTGDSATTEGQTSSGGMLSTGATIKSEDKFSFWATMEAELTSILNAPSDNFKAPTPIINKEAGLVTVSGTTVQVNRIAAYVNELMNRLHKQVLIDVKILSVSLDNSRQTGVDWSQIYSLQNMNLTYETINGKNLSTDSVDNISALNPGLGKVQTNFMKFAGETSVTDLVKFLDSQGDVTSISNPKIVTLSNQPAVFSSGDQLYYKLSSSSRQTGSTTSETYSNEVVESVFAGILLDITPEITDNQEIILKINPSISSIKTDVSTDDGVRRLPPDLMKKQISSVVKLRDGEKIVLGGLISSKKGNTTYKVPVLGNLPVLGYAFKQDIVTEIREELVVIITPHIINPKRDERKIVSLKELGYEGIK